MKIINVILLFVGLLLLLTFSELIYIFRFEPQRLGRIFIYFANNQASENNLTKVLISFDKAANLHLKKNYINYKNKILNTKIKNNIRNLNEFTSSLALDYLKKTLPLALSKNKSPLLSNIYYNLGLIAYENKFHNEAELLLMSAVLIDPELGALYVELANAKLLDNRINEGKKILSDCQTFKLPKKQCQEYLEINVKNKDYLPVGYFKEIIFDYQKAYFD